MHHVIESPGGGNSANTQALPEGANEAKGEANVPEILTILWGARSRDGSDFRTVPARKTLFRENGQCKENKKRRRKWMREWHGVVTHELRDIHDAIGIFRSLVEDERYSSRFPIHGILSSRALERIDTSGLDGLRVQRRKSSDIADARKHLVFFDLDGAPVPARLIEDDVDHADRPAVITALPRIIEWIGWEVLPPCFANVTMCGYASAKHGLVNRDKANVRFVFWFKRALACAERKALAGWLNEVMLEKVPEWRAYAEACFANDPKKPWKPLDESIYSPEHITLTAAPELIDLDALGAPYVPLFARKLIELLGTTDEVCLPVEVEARIASASTARSTRGRRDRSSAVVPRNPKTNGHETAAKLFDELGPGAYRNELLRINGKAAMQLPAHWKDETLRALREDALDLLLRRWGHVKGGEGRVLLLSGEAGIGKSRLSRALQERLIKEPHTPLIYHCSPFHQDSAFYPIIAQVQRAADIGREDSPDIKLDKLEALLSRSSERLADDVPLFAALLSIATPDGRHALPNLTAQRLKECTLAALLANLRNLAAKRPVLMVFEDVHWIDPTSLELLSLAIDQLKDQRILLVATARPEFKQPWPTHRHISTVGLSRLDKAEGETLVAGVTRGKLLPFEVLNQILTRTDGVPLFIEELTKTVLESGLLQERDDHYELTGPLASLAIPSTLHASLLARLDRLASVKDVAQIGAAIGREFSYTLIAAVAVLPEQDLKAALAQLVSAELMFQRGVPPDATYQFKHALVQDAAYASLVRSRRQQLHGQIARAIEERFPDIGANEPELVAHHFTQAGLTDAAIDYWRKAGDRALSRSANAEAIKHLTQGIALTHSLPASPRRDELELALYLPLGPATRAVKGFAAPETLAAFARACQSAPNC